MIAHQYILQLKHHPLMYFFPKKLKSLLTAYTEENSEKIYTLFLWFIHHEHSQRAFLWQHLVNRLWHDLSANMDRIMHKSQDHFELLLAMHLLLLNLHEETDLIDRLNTHPDFEKIVRLIYTLYKKNEFKRSLLTQLIQHDGYLFDMFLILRFEERALLGRKKACLTRLALYEIKQFSNSPLRKLCYHQLLNSTYLSHEELDLIHYIEKNLITEEMIKEHYTRYGTATVLEKAWVEIVNYPNEHLLSAEFMQRVFVLPKADALLLIKEVKLIQEYSPNPEEVLSETLIPILQAIEKKEYHSRQALFERLHALKLSKNKIHIPLLKINNQQLAAFTQTIESLHTYYTKIKWPLILELIAYKAFDFFKIIPVLAKQHKLQTQSLIEAIHKPNNPRESSPYIQSNFLKNKRVHFSPEVADQDPQKSSKDYRRAHSKAF